MRTKKILGELKGNVEPYLTYWREWSQNERCLLSGEEKAIINHYRRHKYELNFLENLLFFREIQKIKFINYKLKYDQKTFREWIIETFLVRLIKLGELNDDKNYKTLIWELELPQSLKESLIKFETFTLNDIFKKYTPEDFQKPVIYNKVLDTLKILKQLDENNELKIKHVDKAVAA